MVKWRSECLRVMLYRLSGISGFPGVPNAPYRANGTPLLSKDLPLVRVRVTTRPRTYICENVF